MATQLKFVVEDGLAERFKRAVLEKHGKLELSKEGAEALRLYLDEARVRRKPRGKGKDPLLELIGVFESRGKTRPNALKDKKALYEEV